MSSDLIKSRIMTVMRNLPPLPTVTRQLLTVIGDDNSSADDVTKVLSGDGMLAAKVLKLVNSSFYGVPSEVTTISRAVVILGFTGIRNLAMGFGAMEALSSMTSSQDMTKYWAHAMATAAAAQSLAPAVSPRTDPEEAFIAGLMHNIGAYIIAAAVPEIYTQIIETPPAERLQQEHDTTGFTHAQLGQALLKFWELPEAFTNAARYHHDIDVATAGDQPLTNLVAMADILACVHESDFETQVTESDWSRLRRGAGLKPDNLVAALEAMDEKISDMAGFMKIKVKGNGSRKSNGKVANLSCVVVSTDEPRRELVEQLLGHFGHKTFPMEKYFNQEAGSSEIDLVMVDPQSLNLDQIERLSTYLSNQETSVCVLTEGGANIPEVVAAWPKLSFVFGSRQLIEMLAVQPAL